MRWPWQRLEKREASEYSDRIIAGILAQASGQVATDLLSAAEAGISMISRALSMATIAGPEPYSRALTPKLLAIAGRELLSAGEVVFLIQVRRGNLRLLPCAAHDVTGGYSEAEWRYRVDLPGPSGWMSRYVSADEVLHFRHNLSAEEPWRGRSPLFRGSGSFELAKLVERSLHYEASVAHGRLIAIPDGTGGEVVEQLKNDLRNLEGKTMLPSTTAAGFGQGRAMAPQADWKPQRIGADFPDAAVNLRAQMTEAVLSMMGLSTVMFAQRGDGTARREAMRQAHHLAFLPLLEVIAEEARAKLDPGLTFTLKRIGAADIQGRSRALATLVKAGVPLEQARSITMLEG